MCDKDFALENDSGTLLTTPSRRVIQSIQQISHSSRSDVLISAGTENSCLSHLVGLVERSLIIITQHSTSVPQGLLGFYAACERDASKKKSAQSTIVLFIVLIFTQLWYWQLGPDATTSTSWAEVEDGDLSTNLTLRRMALKQKQFYWNPNPTLTNELKHFVSSTVCLCSPVPLSMLTMAFFLVCGLGSLTLHWIARWKVNVIIYTYCRSLISSNTGKCALWVRVL